MNRWSVILNDEEDAFFETKVKNGWIEYMIEIIGINRSKKYGLGFNMLHKQFAYSDSYTDVIKKYPELLKAVYLDAKERVFNKEKQKKLAFI